MHKLEFEGIGSSWQIDLLEVPSKLSLRDLKKEIEIRIEQFERDYSRFRNDSLVYEMSQKSGTYNLPSDAEPMFDLYQKLSKITHNLFTPLIGNVLEAAGYDASYSLKPTKLQTPPNWDDALEYKYPILKVKNPITLDMGGIGKGYLIDIVASILECREIKSYCIDAGGDMIYKTANEKKLRVGLENPENAKQVIGVVEILNQSICGSSGNRRKWDKFHHIINPQTLESNWDILATWVIADKTIIADALATCLFLVTPEVLTKEFDFEYLILNKDFSVNKSLGFNVKY